MNTFEKLVLNPGPYQPTSRRSGSPDPTLLRLKNIILYGLEPEIYLQCYKGSLDMGETIPPMDLTGTLTAGLGSKAIVGAGTAFLSELQSGQFFWAGSDLCMVDTVTDDTHITIYRGVSVALVGATGKRTPVIFDINRMRGTLILGNAIQHPKGNILGAGIGTLRRNGAVLAGASLVLTGSPKWAIYDRAAMTFTIFVPGFAQPTVAPVLTSVAGGTHGMTAGENVSLRMCPSRSVTGGFGNASPRANVTVINAGDRIDVDVTAGPALPAGADGWDVYGSLNKGGDQNMGPWNLIRTVPSSEIAANHFRVEYLDSEISRNNLLELNNDPVPACKFVSTQEGFPVYVSVFGQTTSGTPGPSISSGKYNNVEAAPANWVVSTNPPQNILGAVTSQARIYFLTPSSLQQGVYTPVGLTGQPGPLSIPPLSIRSFWSDGFGNPYQLVFANGMLIGCPHGGPTRSIEQDQGEPDQQFIGGYVSEVLASWVGQHILVAEDRNPEVNAVCFFHPADSLNGSGFWTTRVLIWGLRQSAWIGDVTIESTTRDMAVCGVATVDNQLYFLAGGRLGGGIQVDTFKWNTANGTSVSHQSCWQLSDAGAEDYNKEVRSAQVTGLLTSPTVKIYGFDAAVDVDITAIEAGTGSKLSVSFPSTTKVQRSTRQPFTVSNNALFTALVTGTYSGTGTPDRVDRVVMEYLITGPRR